ncbi:MAG: hypothetical protein NHG36_00430 [Chromatiaceae bacterium]|nr:hypothetical protein [Candidatus Thioaporhodococcus sediminis]
MDLATAQAKLDAVLAAYDRALEAASVTLGDRSVVNQKLEYLQAQITWWQGIVSRLTADTDLSVAIATWDS